MAQWEKKIDINKVFVLQPTRPTTYFGVGAVKKIDDILAGMAAKGADRFLVVTDAIAYQASNNTADAPSIALEAQARGVSLAVLADKVLAKATQLAALEAAIAGRCGAIHDAAAAAQSEAELLAIDLEAGWPV